MELRSVPVWEAFADAVLQREALLLRLGEGVPPNDFAGLAVGHDELERIARTLPGLDGPTPADVAGLRAALDPGVEQRRRGLHDSLDDASWFSTLSRRARLHPCDSEVLAIALAVEADRRRQRLLGYVQDDVRLVRLALGTVDRLLGRPGMAARLGPSGPLRCSALVEVEGDGSWAARQLWAPARLVWSLIGHDAPDEALPVSTRVEGPVLPETLDGQLLLVHGADPLSRLEAVRSRWPGSGLLITPPPRDDAGWRAVVREATIGGRVAVLEVDRTDGDVRGWIERAAHVRWVLSSPAELPVEDLPQRPWSEIAADGGPAGDEEWLRWTGRPRRDGPPLSASHLRLVHRVTAGRDGDDLPAAVRRLAGGHLDALARRIRPERGWDDLVLPDDRLAQLQELAARYRWRGRVHDEWRFPVRPSTGIIALFSGPSGTGKTMAAEVVAGSLGLDLYKIDLSAVVSKYIGETEKNLERIFVAAAAGELVLFFDEADALFGKRSEVSDAHDRYANIEVSYLLQRLESYDGLVVLATNLSRNIDEAFLRRITVGVEFPLPNEDERRAIWRTSIPPEAPVSGLDLDFLARQFKVTGGTIRNAALGAAFLAADGGGVIDMGTVIRSLVREFQKTGRLCTEADFDRYYDLARGAPGPTARR